MFLGDTRSAEELAVFTNMASERLCLGCGLRVEETLGWSPIYDIEDRGAKLIAEENVAGIVPKDAKGLSPSRRNLGRRA